MGALNAPRCNRNPRYPQHERAEGHFSPTEMSAASRSRGASLLHHGFYEFSFVPELLNVVSGASSRQGKSAGLLVGGVVCKSPDRLPPRSPSRCRAHSRSPNTGASNTCHLSRLRQHFFPLFHPGGGVSERKADCWEYQRLCWGGGGGGLKDFSVQTIDSSTRSNCCR